MKTKVSQDIQHEEFESVWDALFEDDKEERVSHQLRSDLMIAITDYIKDNKLTQTQAADLFEISQPRVSDIKNSKLSKFTIDSLINILSKTELDIKISVGKASKEVETDTHSWMNTNLFDFTLARNKKRRDQLEEWDCEVSDPHPLYANGS